MAIGPKVRFGSGTSRPVRKPRNSKLIQKERSFCLLSPDGKRLYTCGSDYRFRCWDLGTFKQLGEFGDEKPGMILRMALSPDGLTLATAHRDDALRIWDARTFKKRYQLTGEPGQQIGAIAFSPDSSLLAWSDGSAGIRLTDAASGQEVRRLPSPANSFDGIVFAPGGKTLAWGINYPGRQNVVGIWEVRSGQLRRTLNGSDGPTLPLAHSPNGALLVTAGSDCSALVWDMNRRPNGKHVAGIPSPEKLDQCWRLLADHDAAKAFDCMETLAQFPEQGVARIAENLKPIPPRAPAEKVAALCRDLDGDLFEAREAATRELERLDETVITDLQRLAKKSESAEARSRAERLLERLDPLRLQRERAIEILEMIGNPSAVKLLKSLADGQPDAPLTRDARGALQRLQSQRIGGRTRSSTRTLPPKMFQTVIFRCVGENISPCVLSYFHSIIIFRLCQPREGRVRIIEEPVSWVVYQMTLHGKSLAMNAVCEQDDWDAMEASRPGYHTLIRSGIANEGEAEKLARGTSGDAKGRGVSTNTIGSGTTQSAGSRL